MQEYIVPYLDQVRVPTASSNVHKEECCFSFTTPESEDGLFIDLNSFLAFSKEFAIVNTQKTGHKLYLNIKRIFHLAAKGEEDKSKSSDEPPKKKPTLMAIGVTGGFDVDDDKDWVSEDLLAVVVIPEFKVFPLPDPSLPEKIQLAITGIIAATSSERQDEVKEWVAEQQESKHARTLKQLDNGVKIPPKGWKCANCDLTENLWMNLTDGAILCGRKNWDGSGGNGHAMEHFKKTGFPLCVKLGTISAEGKADVYSYAEEDMVIDPLLNEHLLHFGIKVSQMEKTEKTIAEMEIDMNLNFDWSRLQENSKQLVPAYGPGFTGLVNLGNSCYMASVMQTMFSLPEFRDRYFANADDAFKGAPSDPTTDFFTQMCKLGKGLLSGSYSQPPKELREGEKAPKAGIAPRMLKTIIGKGHPEFSSARQQDVLEYFQHLLSLIKKDEHKRSQGSADLSRLFEFQVEERTQCTSSGKVRYMKRVDNVLSLPIPLERATNKEEVRRYEEEQKAKKEERERRKKEAEASGLPVPKEEDSREDPVRPRIPFADCLQAFAAPEEIPGFYSTAINAKTVGIRSNRIATFPRYLVVQMRKFTIGDDWTPKKLDVFLDVPDELDLEPLRGHGLQKGEEPLPEEPKAAPKVDINEDMVQQLESMGFPRARCVKAVYNTKNAGAETAMNWLMEHMDDADIDVPLDLGGQPAKKEESVDEDAVATIMSMGFPRQKAVKALKATGNNLERASDWIFSHMDDDDSGDQMEVEAKDGPAKKEETEDGVGRYRLRGFISHMGTSTASGHYVCHLRKEGKWYLYNDQKVAVSEDTPKDMGYLYLWERVSQ